MYNDKTRPRKSLGQNFLKDENIARKIIASLNLSADDCVLEIGSGTGALTKYLVQFVFKVVAIEIDKNLVQQLSKQFSSVPNFFLYHDDILKIPFEQILSGHQSWQVVANLPYHITSPVLFKLFEYRHWFDSATVMVQKEVAQRMVARSGTKAYGILSVFSQLYAEVKILFDVSKHVFFPEPEVMSSVVHLDFIQQELLNRNEEYWFRKIVKGVFAHRRKMLRNSLLSIPDLTINLDQLQLNLTQRPEQLSVSDFIELTKRILTIGHLAKLSPK